MENSLPMHPYHRSHSLLPPKQTLSWILGFTAIKCSYLQSVFTFVCFLPQLMLSKGGDYALCLCTLFLMPILMIGA